MEKKIDSTELLENKQQWVTPEISVLELEKVEAWEGTPVLGSDG